MSHPHAPLGLVRRVPLRLPKCYAQNVTKRQAVGSLSSRSYSAPGRFPLFGKLAVTIGLTNGLTNGLTRVLTGALLGAFSLTACSGTPGDDTPTDSPAPATPVPVASRELTIISATEADLTVSFAQAHAVTLKFGQSSYTYTRTVETAAATQVVHLYGLQPETTWKWQLYVDEQVVDEDTFSLPAAPVGPFRVLFDNSHGQQSGNADWVIDNDSPNPSPSSPASAEDWRGAYSSWGYDLFKSGRYVVTTNKSTLSDSVLSNVDALVVPEPNTPFSSNEISAMQRFVFGGGGLFIMANHSGSDRDGDGWDAVRVWQAVLSAFNPSLGITFQEVRDTDDPCSNLFSDPLDPVTAGPFGLVRYMGFNAGSLMTSSIAKNDTLQGLAWPDSTSQGYTQQWAVRGRYGEGRVVAISDSSPADDGTGQSGDELYDSWNLGDQQNDAFHLNATAWLVGDAGD